MAIFSHLVVVLAEIDQGSLGLTSGFLLAPALLEIADATGINARTSEQKMQAPLNHLARHVPKKYQIGRTTLRALSGRQDKLGPRSDCAKLIANIRAQPRCIARIDANCAVIKNTTFPVEQHRT